MAVASPPPALREEDYEAIEAAVMETTRGRWFLAEFARRNRSADTNVLLDAIGKLEGLMRRERKTPKLERIQLDLADMMEAIQRTKREIAQIKHESEDGDRFAEASSELDAIVTQTEGATQNILHRAELVQELAWTLREQGVDEAVCDDIDAHTTEIFMACSFQDLTGQRTQRVVQVLRYLESRINEMMDIWDFQSEEMNISRPDPINPEEHRPDAHLLHGPQNDDKAIKQNDVDALMDIDALLAADANEAGVLADNIEFATIEAEDEAGAEADEPEDMTADTFEAVSADETGTVEDTSAEAADADEGTGFDSETGEFDINAISFDKIDLDDDASPDADTDSGFAAVEVEEAEVETETEDAEAKADAFAAGKVLEDMLDVSKDDEFAAFGSGPKKADETETGFRSDEDEEDADAAFMDMDAAVAVEEAEDDEADPLRALSAGERLALFS